jgi:hypothetical protein
MRPWPGRRQFGLAMAISSPQGSQRSQSDTGVPLAARAESFFQLDGMTALVVLSPVKVDALAGTWCAGKTKKIE